MMLPVEFVFTSPEDAQDFADMLSAGKLQLGNGRREPVRIADPPILKSDIGLVPNDRVVYKVGFFLPLTVTLK